MESKVPSSAKLPTKFGLFDIHVHHEEKTGLDHVALMMYRENYPSDVLKR